MTTQIEIPNELLEPMQTVFRHYLEAKKLHPVFPEDLIYQGSILAEEAGECLKECNNQNYGLARHECGQTAAVAIRMLIHLKEQ